MFLFPKAWVQPLLFSAKTVAAGFLALWIGLWVGVPFPFWAMTTAFIVIMTVMRMMWAVVMMMIGGGDEWR